VWLALRFRIVFSIVPRAYTSSLRHLGIVLQVSHAARWSYTWISVFYCSFVVSNQTHHLRYHVNLPNLEIFICGKGIDCHPAPVIHLLRSISCHPLLVIHLYPVAIHIRRWWIPRGNPSPVMHFWQQSHSGHNQSLAAIHFRPSSLRLHPFLSTLSIIVCIWAAFRDCFRRSVSPLKIIYTNLHNIRLPLNLHRSPRIHPVTYHPS